MTAEETLKAAENVRQAALDSATSAAERARLAAEQRKAQLDRMGESLTIGAAA